MSAAVKLDASEDDGAPAKARRSATERLVIRGIGKGYVPGSKVRLYGHDMEVVGNDVEGDIPAEFVENEIKYERMERKG